MSLDGPDASKDLAAAVDAGAWPAIELTAPEFLVPRLEQQRAPASRSTEVDDGG